MSSPLVLAVDPGKSTGLATYDLKHDLFWSSIVSGRSNARDQIRSYMSDSLIVVAEKWSVRRDTYSKSAQDDPWRLLGWLEGECTDRGIEYYEQTPAQMKSFIDKGEKLRRLGWYRPGAGHDNDAAGHLLVWLVRHPEGRHLLKELV